MMRIVINPNDLSKPERAEERIADLEKQLAEERNNVLRLEERLVAYRNQDYELNAAHSALAEERILNGAREMQAIESDRALRAQLAEQTKRAEADRAKALRQENHLARWVTEATERAEAAEYRVVELQALVDAARTGLVDITDAAERMLRIVDGYTFRRAEEAALGTPARRIADLLPEMRRLARELAAKEEKK